MPVTAAMVGAVPRAAGRGGSKWGTGQALAASARRLQPPVSSKAMRPAQPALRPGCCRLRERMSSVAGEGAPLPFAFSVSSWYFHSPSTTSCVAVKTVPVAPSVPWEGLSGTALPAGLPVASSSCSE